MRIQSVRSVFRPAVLMSAVSLILLAGTPGAFALSSRVLLAPTGSATNDAAGFCVASAGDVNGDGYDDVIVGTPGFDTPGTDAGRAQLFLGGPSADAVADVTITGAAGDSLGRSVAPAGDMNGDGYADFVVGAPRNDGTGADAGRAYVYLGGPVPNGVADLTLSDGAAGDLFGFAVAPAGDVNGDGFGDILVGAPFNDLGGANAGRMFLYLGGPALDNSWDFSVNGVAAGDNLGWSQSGVGDVNGDRLADFVASAPLGGTTGRVYIYFGATSPLPSTVLSGAAASDNFGGSVSGAGDVNGDGYADILVGAPLNDTGGTDAGRAYVYYGSPIPDAVADLTITGAAGDRLGWSVASAGDVNRDTFADLVIGAPNVDGIFGDMGRASVYFGGSSPDAVADISFAGSWPSDNVGWSVAGAGDADGDGFDDVAYGMPGADSPATNAGRAYVQAMYAYRVLSPNGGEQWAAGRPATVRWLGHDAADVQLSTDGGLSWTTLASGVGSEETNSLRVVAPASATDHARLRVTYAGQAASLATSDASDADFRIALPLPAPAAAAARTIQPLGALTYDQFGVAVGGGGDVNGDGWDDVIVGASLAFTGSSTPGRAYLYYGGPGADATADLVLTGATDGESFGYSVALGGDMNGDGYGDMVVGATLNGAGGLSAGRAYIYFGGPVPDAIADLVVNGAAANDQLGYSVSFVGSMNGDPFDDVLVGAPFNAAGGAGAGRAYLILGGMTPDATPDLLLTGVASDYFGMTLDGAGDLNADGYDDVVVGAPAGVVAGSIVGRAYVFLGSRVLDSTADLVLSGDQSGGNFGYGVSDAGDMNGDGFDDLLIGAYSHNGGGTGRGRCYLVLGGATLDRDPDLVVDGRQTYSGFGVALAALGDVNGDGYDDIALGAPWTFHGQNYNGEVQVFFGGPVPDAVPDVILTGSAVDDQFGYGVARAGSAVPGAFGALVSGAPGYDSYRGRASVFGFGRYQVLSPTAGSTWNVGASKTVRWTGSEPADLWLSVDGGRSFDLLQPGVGGADSNSVAIRVPHAPTKFARVRVTPADASINGLGESDSLFTIQSSVTLLTLSASRTAEGTVLSWASEPAVGPEGILGYRLFRAAPGQTGEGVAIGEGLLVTTAFTDASGVPGSVYRLRAVNGLGEELELGSVTAGSVMLGMKVWPSPVSLGASGPVRVAFGAPLGSAGHPASDLDVAVFDVSGRRVVTLARGQLVPSAGVVELAWDGRDGEGLRVASGVYLVRASAPAEGFQAERKLIVRP